VDKLFLKDDDPKKYHGPAMPPAIEVLQQLAGGLEYIHQMNFIHRDIKPGNVLIWVDPATQNVLMKWADFGFSKRVNERGSHSISGSNRGTDNWYAPEILLIKIQEEESGKDETAAHQRGTVKSDVFAQGLVFGFYLLNGQHLFGSRVLASANILSNNPVHLDSKSRISNEPKLKIQTFESHNFPNYVEIQPQSIRDLIQKMLEPGREVRISSSEVFQHLQRHQQLEMKNDKS
jgi:serine/threonine protein kinase